MARYKLQDSVTGKTVTIEADSAPTQDEAEGIFQEAGLRNQQEKGIPEKIAGFAAPRTLQFGKDVMSAIQKQQETGQAPEMNPVATGLGPLGAVLGGSPLQRSAAGAGAEVGQYLLGAPKLTGSFLQKLIQGIPQGVLRGSTYAATNPEDISLGKRAGQTALGGALGVPLGMASSAIQIGSEAVTNKLKDIGAGWARRVVKPETGTSPGWAEREQLATKSLLENTSGVTPEGIDKSISKKLTDTTRQITTTLKKVEKPLEIQGEEGIEGILDTTMKSKFPVLKEPASPNYGEYAQAVVDVKSKIMDNATGHESGRVMTTIRPEKLFDAKQEIGNELADLGVWKKLSRGEGLNPEERIKLESYKLIKTIIDKTSPGISKLTEMESKLFDVAKGVYKMGHQADYKPAIMNPRTIPILSQLLGLYDVGSMAGSRALYGANPAIANQALSGVLTPNVINKTNQ